VRRFYALLVLAILAFGCNPRSAQAAKRPTRAEILTSVTVALVTQEDWGTRAYCSGVWVTQDVIVTAYHCVKDEVVVLVATRDDAFDGYLEREKFEGRPALVINTLPGSDLALLRVIGPTHRHAIAPLAKTVTQGQAVHTMGHPRGIWFSYSSGHVAAVRWLDTSYADCLMVQSTAAISGGNSGGGLFDSNGALLGIAHAQRPDGQNINFYIHVASVRALLAGTKL
jgi:S1-C subfamily serine protease